MLLQKSMCVFPPLFVYQSKKWLNIVRGMNYSTFRSSRKSANYSEKDIINANKLCNLSITHLDFNDSTISKIMLQVKSKKTRAKSNLMFFEGKRILKEALEAGVNPVMVFFSRKESIEDLKFSENTKLFKVPYNEMKVWSSLTTAPGILAVCRKPDIIQTYKPDVPVTIICDNVREPANLGALIRNAVGAGVKDIILTKGCVDLWDPKVIRGSAGTQFRIPIHIDIDWSEIRNYIANGTVLLMATNKHFFDEIETECNNCLVPYIKVNYCTYSNITVIIGGETEGISEQAHRLMQFYDNKMVTIPLSNEVESLNSVSALSIILFEIKRQIMLV